MQTEITEILDAISKEIDTEKFFSKTLLFLSKSYCKKCEIIWEENGKIISIKKVGRNKIEKQETRGNLASVQEDGYKIIPLDIISLFPKKAILKVKLKSKVSEKKFNEIVDIISHGADIVIERRKKIEEIHNISLNHAEILNLSLKIPDIVGEIIEKYENEEEAIEKIFQAIAKIIRFDNISAIITLPDRKIEKLYNEKDAEMRKFIEQKLNNIPQTLPQNSLIYEIPIKSEKVSGSIFIKTTSRISEETFRIISSILQSTITGIEGFKQREEEKSREKIIEILNELDIGISILYRDPANLSISPIFENPRFKEIKEKSENLKELIKSSITESISFGIERRQKIKVGENTFALTIKPISENYSIAQITEEKYESQKEIEKILSRLNLLQKIISNLHTLLKNKESTEISNVENFVLKSLESLTKTLSRKIDNIKISEISDIISALKDIGVEVEEEIQESNFNLPADLEIAIVWAISNFLTTKTERKKEKCKVKVKLSFDEKISESELILCLQRADHLTIEKFQDEEVRKNLRYLGIETESTLEKDMMKYTFRFLAQ